MTGDALSSPQDMQVAVVTPCSHFFHAACLRKWLYVQDTCPMCHQRVTPAGSEDNPAAGTAAHPAPDGGDEVPEDGGAPGSRAPARPWEDGLPGAVAQDRGAGDFGHRLAHGHLREQEAGATPQPPGDPHPDVQDTWHPSPASPAHPDPSASPWLGTMDSRDSRSGHPHS